MVYFCMERPVLFLSYFITRITRNLYVLWNTKFANDEIRTIQVAFEIRVYPLFESKYLCDRKLSWNLKLVDRCLPS